MSDPRVLFAVIALAAITALAMIELFHSVCYAPARPVAEESGIKVRIIRK